MGYILATLEFFKNLKEDTDHLFKNDQKKQRGKNCFNQTV